MHSSQMRRRRRWSAVAAVLVALLVPATSAQAALPPAGTWSTQTGPRSASGASGGSATWDAGGRSLTVQVQGYGLAPGRCQTTYFDWTSPAAHHDLRGVRTCRNDSVARNGWTETVPVTGVRKLRVCNGPLNRMGTCSVNPQATPSLLADWSGARGRTCASWLLVSTSGTITVNSGGDPRRCDA